MKSIIKIKIIFFLILFFGLFGLAKSSWAACTGSSPTWNCTADSTSAQINACIGNATGGDTINIGAGTGTWTTTVVITRGLHLVGAGSGSTTINHGTSTYAIQVDPTDQSINPEFEITGFTFNSNDKHLIRLGNDCTNLTKFQTNVNIHDNVFLGSVTSNHNCHYINTYCTGGAVWKNTFTGADQQITSNGWGTGTDPLFTSAPDVRGTANALFLEDNVFNMDTTDSCTYFKDSQFAASSIVWRYNTFNLAQSQPCPFLDWHGYSNENYQSSYGDEVYGNNIIPPTGGAFGGWAGARGSMGLIFYNNATTSGTVGNGTYCGGYGCSTRTLGILKTYTWMQGKNLNSIITTPTYDSCTEFDPMTCDGINDYPKYNWNQFNQIVAFDGSAGIGCGSSLPDPTGYAERVGYWVTNQSCSSVSGLVGDIVNNPSRGTISGTLYTIQSGAWVNIFTPYTYPHPLRDESDTTAPSVPQGLSVQ